MFEELFGLDTALLRSGGKDLINSQGRLGQVLFAAGGGLGRIRDLLTELERRRDDLGRANRRHTSRPLWAAFATWEQANTDLRKSALRPADFTAMEKAAAEAAKQLHDLLAEQSADATERDRLRTVAACRPWLERLAAARSVLETAAGVPDVDETFERRWRDALEEGAKSASAAATANAELLAARTARDGLSFDPAWLGVAADIAALADQRGLARNGAVARHNGCPRRPEALAGAPETRRQCRQRGRADGGSRTAPGRHDSGSGGPSGHRRRHRAGRSAGWAARRRRPGRTAGYGGAETP